MVKGKQVPYQTVYWKGWWKTGSKKLYRSKGEISLWSGQTGEIETREVNGEPVVDRAFAERTGGQLAYYLDNQQSGPYRDIPGLVIWTDGARKKRGEMLTVGAGVFCPKDEELNKAFVVGGEAKPIRG